MVVLAYIVLVKIHHGSIDSLNHLQRGFKPKCSMRVAARSQLETDAIDSRSCPSSRVHRLVRFFRVFSALDFFFECGVFNVPHISLWSLRNSASLLAQRSLAPKELEKNGKERDDDVVLQRRGRILDGTMYATQCTPPSPHLHYLYFILQNYASCKL
jgi:hypothetical protein